jgi:hypothetical protein
MPEGENHIFFYRRYGAIEGQVASSNVVFEARNCREDGYQGARPGRKIMKDTLVLI